MPFTSVTGGVLSGFTNTGATLSFSYMARGAVKSVFTLVATPVGGGAPVEVSVPFNVQPADGPASGKGTINFTFPTTLANGNFNFQASATQTGNPQFPNVASATNVPIICFLAGTMIATPGGEAAVETLVPGDLILTADGRQVPVLWLGAQSLSSRFGMSEERLPVRIAAGALGDGLPLRDLRVTAGHALLLDGVLVNAGALVNGTTITRMTPAELGERFTVYHVETAAHDIILAEGTPSETFIDNTARRNFDNYAEFVAVFGAEDRPMVELDQPRALSARQVPPAIRARIAAEAAQREGAAASAA